MKNILILKKLAHLCFEIIWKKYIQGVINKNENFSYLYFRDFMAKSFYLLLIPLFLITQSCSEMNDLHFPYLNEGETVYAAKIDSAHLYSGDERVKIDMFLWSQNVETLRIFWNHHSDSMDININGFTGKQECIIDNLNEGSHIFNIYCIDKHDNSSLPFELVGNVYGDIFKQQLVNRNVLSWSLAGNELSLTWSGAVSFGIANELIFKNLENQMDTIIVSMQENNTVISNFKSDFKYRTLFLPEETAIDTFFTSFSSLSFEN
jgi:hypothetical protein